ncbi:HTH-type transcriptional activator RhaS [Posidoniimonas polymericola]|uniref:HTH-type transcriptional activator RhaS n=1 Tax=Posidoniimonas polymericola TaxID=2528002 RepID=A0A5C5YL89_9BACT|nr:AraC family transcriptional regulator [Posidoniimonas polymericola]TWT75695.1 HTH-type transcriptional activator RhaS [Posidoniimonas polymericola]
MPAEHATADATRHSFFESVGSPLQLLELLDHLPATYFFAKDLQGRFVHINAALLEALGLCDERLVIGRTDHDLFLPQVADRYRSADAAIIESGNPLTDHVCAVPNASGVLRWYVETKIPLLDSRGRTVGVAGMMYDLAKAGAMLAPYERLNEAITHITNHYEEKITLENLAELSHLSVSQFKRVFKQLFRQTPAKYVTHVRINAACLMLRETSLTLESIAVRTGFYDASHFSRLFKAEMNQTPRSFREQTTRSEAQG